MENDFTPPSNADWDALKTASTQFHQQLLRQQENQARLQEIAAQLQLCMIAVSRGQVHPDPKDRLDIAKIAIAHMTQMNNRTGSYAAALGACAEQLGKELQAHEDLAHLQHLVRLHRGEVSGGHHGTDTGMHFGLAGVDGLDPSVGMGAPEDLAVQQAAGLEVASVEGPSCYLIPAIVPKGACAYHFILSRRQDHVVLIVFGSHTLASCILPAASITARTILS